MCPVSNQPGRFFAIANTNKFTSLNDITDENLKLRPIIDLTRTYTYNTSKIVAKLFTTIFKESIHHLRYLKDSGLTKKCRYQC